MSYDQSEKYINDIAKSIKAGSRVGILTGAGISTNSGIPDFRSNREGSVYSKYPTNSLSLSSFYDNRKLFYDIYLDKFESIYKAEPTKAHKIISEWEEKGYLSGIVTQNVDMLHQKAGNTKVVNFHGDAYTFIKVGLQEARKVYGTKKRKPIYTDDIIDISNLNYEEKLDKIKELSLFLEFDDNEVPYVYKPNMVLFEEDVQGYFKAEDLLSDVDLLLIIGTTYKVGPFNSLHLIAGKNNYISPEIYFINDKAMDNDLRWSINNLYGDIDYILERINRKL